MIVGSQDRGTVPQVDAGQQFGSGVERRHLRVSLQLPMVVVRMPLHRQLPIAPLDLVGSEREQQVRQRGVFPMAPAPNTPCDKALPGYSAMEEDLPWRVQSFC